MGFEMIYPLENLQKITMESHEFQWINQASMDINGHFQWQPVSLPEGTSTWSCLGNSTEVNHMLITCMDCMDMLDFT